MEMRYSVPKAMPRGTHYGNNYWLVPSAKMNRYVTAFSNLEYFNIMMLEMDATVEGYCEQPCELEMPELEPNEGIRNRQKTENSKDDDKTRHVIPDMYVLYKDGLEEMQEVKYMSEINSNDEKGERSRRQINLEKQWCLQHGLRFALRTDEILAPNKYLISNMAFMQARVYREGTYLKTDVLRRLRIVFDTDRKKVTVQDLRGILGISPVECWNVVANLYYHGYLTLNMNGLLDQYTEVHLLGDKKI